MIKSVKGFPANNAERLIMEESKKNKVFLLSSTTSPHSIKCKQALNSVNASYHVMTIDTTNTENSDEFLNAVNSLTGNKYLPKVWVGGRLIGGIDEVLATLAHGKLHTMIGR